MDFQAFIHAQDKRFNRAPYDSERILSFDPGHTTGWAFFANNTLQAYGQINTKTMDTAPHNIMELFVKYDPTQIVFEDYRIYKGLAEHHEGSSVQTIHVIGAIETLCAFKFLPYSKRMAAPVKNFCTDKKLTDWGFKKKGMRHAMDAIRHGCYQILFYHADSGKSTSPYKKVVG
ncbi:MAG: hypothetical protein COA78_07115 [Blastopirellula sp.]|nr:MAG: hypothetical protein COA78_07115 [Blastopirellula sp.]